MTEASVIERLCTELKASELERQIIRTYFKIDPNIRDPFVRQLIRVLSTEQNNDMETAKESTPVLSESLKPMPQPDADILSEKVAILEKQNKEIMAQNQALAAEIAAIREEDAAMDTAKRMAKNVTRSLSP